MLVSYDTIYGETILHDSELPPNLIGAMLVFREKLNWGRNISTKIK